MKPSTSLALHRERIRRIVATHRGANPRVFGSTARGTDREGSDLDILVDGTPDMSLLDLALMQDEIARLTQVKVDILTSHISRPTLRNAVLAEAVPL